MPAPAKYRPAPRVTTPNVTAALPQRRYLTLDPQQLTERYIRELQPVAGEVIEIPARQYKYLRLRVTANTKAWSVLRRQRGGKVQRVALGHWPELNCTEAIDRAEAVSKQLRDGDNPVALRRAAATAVKRRSLTLRDALTEYITRKALRPATVTAYWSSVTTSCPDWLDAPLAAITPERVAELHRERALTSKAGANKVARTLRAVAKYQNATRKMALPAMAEILTATKSWAKLNGRTDHLSGATLRAWVTAVRALPEDVPAKTPDTRARDLYGSQRDALLLMLCTALRLREALGLRWDEVNLSERLLVIRGERAKNGREHALPIGPQITAMLRRRYKHRRSDVFVFAGPDPEQPIDRISRRVFERIKSKGKVIPFTPHGLRRSALTLLESKDVSAYALKKIANHADGADVTSGYLQVGVERLRPPMLQLERAVFTMRGTQ